MKAHWWLPIFLILSSLYVSISTFAQTPPPTDSSQLNIRSTGDTLQAIHQLFLSRRQNARTIIWTGAGVAVGLGLIGLGSHALVSSVKRTTSGQPLEEGAVSVSLKFSIPGLAIVGLGLLRHVRFNRHRESALMSTYEQGKGLHPSIRRSLKSQYFTNR